MTGISAVAAAQQASTVFPNLEIELEDERRDRSMQHRLVGQYPVALFRAPATRVAAVGHRAVTAGFGRHLKLTWQLRGQMRFENAERALVINTGDMLITSMSSDYWMEMQEEHEALVVVFDPGDQPHWSGLAYDMLGHKVGARAGTAAAAGGVGTLLNTDNGDQTGEAAVKAMIDLALASAQPEQQPEDAFLGKAALRIVENIADPGYGPARLARDLGMSRRSLYSRLKLHDTTPQALIRRVRIDRARADIVAGDGRSLLEIALANGFQDGAGLSHAFRTAFGQPPSSFRS